MSLQFDIDFTINFLFEISFYIVHFERKTNKPAPLTQLRIRGAGGLVQISPFVKDW